jgi:hypothetical protein
MVDGLPASGEVIGLLRADKDTILKEMKDLRDHPNFTPDVLNQFKEKIKPPLAESRACDFVMQEGGDQKK